MKQARHFVYPCVVDSCRKEGKVPLCSGELHLCHGHFDHWVDFLRKNPLLVEKWSTENLAVWNRHFSAFVHEQIKVHNACV